MIRKLENPLLLPKILEMAKTVPDVPMEHLEKILLGAINDKDSVIYIADDKEQIRGFIYASKEYWNGEEVAFIQLCVIKPDNMERFIGFELLTKIRLWAMENNIKDLIFSTKRNPKGFMRRYRFTFEGYILKRKVKGD